MRLIDADALREQVAIIARDSFCLDNSYQRFIDALKAVDEAVENEPTVDAIPIEWIKEYIELQESYDTDVGDIFGVGVRGMLRYCAERKEE